jgi:cytochrome c oxidase subunit 2
MDRWIPLFPKQASTLSRSVDRLFLFEIAVAVFFSVLIFGLILVFAIRYRRRSDAERPRAILGDLRLELVWTLIPLGLTMVMFGWGASLYFRATHPPAGAMQITVVAKQWMWKFQHPTGQREIDTLHVPVGQPVELLMTSEDVIHSLFIPAFRVKKDVLPGRYTTLWFQATRPGRYHLFCTQYCGTGHAGMIGWVYALQPADFEAWLGGRRVSLESPVERGRALFQRLGCVTCHIQAAPERCPRLEGLYGKTVKLTTGGTVVADEGYIRESILEPQAKIVAGYQAVMPTYTSQLKEEDVLDLIAYIKSLSPPLTEAGS